MKTLKQYMKCDGCEQEVFECYNYQKQGYNSGLKFDNDEHLSFFVIDKNGKFIVK